MYNLFLLYFVDYDALQRCKKVQAWKMFPISVKIWAQFYAVCRKSDLCRNFAHFGVIFWQILENWCYFLEFFLHYFGLLGLLRCYANSLLSQFQDFFGVQLFWF